MAAQAVDLVAQRLFRDGEILRLPVRPVLPVIATAPAGDEQNSALVGQVEKFLGFQLAFEADGVQPHVLHIAELVAQALRVFAQHHVGRPAAAADQDVFAVDRKQAPVGREHLGLDLANAKFCLRAVGNLAVQIEFQAEAVALRLAHLRRPPQARMVDIELGKLLRSKGHILRLAGPEFDFLRKFDLFDLAFERPLDRVIGGILQQRRDGEVGLVVGPANLLSKPRRDSAQPRARWW